MRWGSEAMGDFVWCDLSAYRPDRAAVFYADVLGWHVEPGDYSLAFADGEAVAAIHPMPDPFRRIGMPSFWMSHVGVPCVARTVAAARAEGGRVELENAVGEGGRIALIRDPLGAGFTVYEGTMPPGARERDRSGLRAAHDLHVSDAAAVAGFYGALFGWRLEGAAFVAASGRRIAGVRETTEAERGGFEYWGITFAVDDAGAAARRVEAGGGTLHGPVRAGMCTVLSVADPDGAAFFLVDTDGA